VWQRVEPLLRSRVNEARDKRLIREGGEDYRLRRQLVLMAYANFLKSLPPILLSLAPTATQFYCENRALADALALGSGPDEQLLKCRIVGAISILRPELEKRKRERAARLRSLLPKSDVSENATDDEAISLATSVFECSDCRLPSSGLHTLAHECDQAPKPNTLHPQLSEIGRATVQMLLQLLGLGRETTALELDRRNDKFVCLRCSRGSFPQHGKEVLGRCVRDWRSCVRLNFASWDVYRALLMLLRLQVTHAISARSERWHKGGLKWHLVGQAEMAGFRWQWFLTNQAYGCLHCPTRINPGNGSIQWYAEVGEVREHIRKE
jgi:hypothetical protein